MRRSGNSGLAHSLAPALHVALTKNIEDAAREGHELFLDVCESFRYGIMSYGSEQAIPREIEMQRIIQAIPDNTQKYQRYLELTAKRASDVTFTIPRGRRWWQTKSY